MTESFKVGQWVILMQGLQLGDQIMGIHNSDWLTQGMAKIVELLMSQKYAPVATFC